MLPVIRKVIEGHVYNELYSFLQRFELINGSQSGFRQYHSCETALIKLTNDFLKAMNAGKVTFLLSCDFMKCYDLLPHNILLEKLKIYGCTDSALKWFTSFIENIL